MMMMMMKIATDTIRSAEFHRVVLLVAAAVLLRAVDDR